MTPAGDPVSGDIGSAGGTIATPNGAISLVFPAGALATTTTVTIQPIVNTAANSFGLAYQIKPAGLVLAKPITITLSIAPSAIGDQAPEGLGVGVMDATGQWKADFQSTVTGPGVTSGSARGAGVSSVDEDFLVALPVNDQLPLALTISTFWKVDPKSATVAEGGSVPLQILACTEERLGDGGDVTLPLKTTCAPSARQGTWLVNAVVGGSAQAGHVTALSPSSTARYDAPAVAPGGGTVLVQAQLLWVQRGLTAFFKIPITITSSNWTGTLTYTQTGDTTYAGDTHLGEVVHETWGGTATIEVTGHPDPNFAGVGFLGFLATKVTLHTTHTVSTHFDFTSDGCHTVGDAVTALGANGDDFTGPDDPAIIGIVFLSDSYSFKTGSIYFNEIGTQSFDSRTTCPDRDPDETHSSDPTSNQLRLPPQLAPLAPLASGVTSISGEVTYRDTQSSARIIKLEWVFHRGG